MIRDDSERVIGKLININSEKFTVELLNRAINFTINGFDDIYQYAQINGYVILPYQDYYIVAEIFGVREKDADLKWGNEKEHMLSKANSIKFLDISPIGTIQKDEDGSKVFKYGLSIFPTLYSDVLYIKKDELDIIFDRTNEFREMEMDGERGTRLSLLEIGSSTIFPDYKVKVDINGFFGHHSAVLGNTGSGKSCTISSMVQKLFSKDGFSATGATFIFFDVNGEYHKAFCRLSNVEIQLRYFSVDKLRSREDFSRIYCNGTAPFHINEESISYEEFKLPHWFLNIDEWVLLLQASEKTQLPILRSALGFSQGMDTKSRMHIYASNIMYVLENWDSTVAKRQRISALIRKGGFTDLNISKMSSRYGSWDNEAAENEFRTAVLKYIDQEAFISPRYLNNPFEFSSLEEYIEDAILYEEYHGNKQIRDYCSSLLTRLKSLVERDEFNFLMKQNELIAKNDFVEKLLGGIDCKNKKTQISIIDLNSIDNEIVEVISCVISRMVFEKLKAIEPRNMFPVNLVLEEAHRYVAEEKGSKFGNANKVFESIAKEGRKYGMFLLLSSQRPSELSRTVLSQCSNFIVHRIQNPEDLSQIRQMTPHISASILGRLPSIPRQHALIFGHSIEIPTLFKVNNADPTPHSSDNDIVSNWFHPRKTYVDLPQGIEISDEAKRLLTSIVKDIPDATESEPVNE